jgi:hypothetical protein
MDSIVTSFLSLPNVVIYAIFGAIGGALGSLVGSLLSKIFKKEKLSGIITIVFVVLAIQLPNHILPQMKKAAAPNQVMQELKGQRLFSVIFRLHPEAEEELKLKMTDVINNSPNDQVFYKAQAASAEIVAKYLNKHMVSASDEVTYKQIQREAKVIASFQNKPQLCVSYYFGNPQFSKDDITPEFLNEESNLKADLIESSVSNPSMPPKAASIDEIINIIAESYQKNGYDLQGLAKIDQVATLPPAEGCKIAIDFSKALAAMEQKQAAYVFKNLLYISSQQQ